MTTRARSLLTVSLFPAAAAAGALLVFQHDENATLREELGNFPATATATAAPVSSLPRSAGETPANLPRLVATNGAPARRELALRILQAKRDKDGLLKSMWSAAPLLEEFPAEALLTIFNDQPVDEFSARVQGAFDENVPGETMADACARYLAWRRLAVVAPRRALEMCERPAGRKNADYLLNEVWFCMRHLVPEDPVGALRWAKNHPTPATPGDRYPGNRHVNMVLLNVTKESMKGACDLARGEGLKLTDYINPLATAGTLADVDTLMAEVTREQAAAPGGFVEGSTKQYQTLTEKIAAAQGFEGARAFAEKWAVALPLRDDVALTAATAALALQSTPEAAAAADWMMEFIPEPRRADAVEKLISTWADADFTAPAEWLQNHKAAPWRDAGLAALCRKIAPFDPDAAAEWAAGIADETLRASLKAVPAATP